MRRFTLYAVVVGALLAAPRPALAAPRPVQAWYVYGTTASGVESAAYNHGCSFASSHPGGTRLLNLDFGAARKLDADTWGTVDFSGVRLSNSSILEALKAAADGHHNCYSGVGSTVVAYGNSNYHMTGAGMTTDGRVVRRLLPVVSRGAARELPGGERLQPARAPPPRATWSRPGTRR